MKHTIIKGNLSFISFLLLLLLSTSQAETWFVRPAGGDYGLEDGTSYENAWEGSSNIDWIQINPGDILYVCGLHTVDGFPVLKSGEPDNPITIKGDYPVDPGTIFSVGGILDSAWTLIDSANNVWHRSIPFGVVIPWGPNYYYEKYDTAGVEGISLLNIAQDTTYSTWLPGTYYLNEPVNAIYSVYYKPSTGNAYDYMFYIGGIHGIFVQEQDYFSVENINIIGASGTGLALVKTRHVKISGVTIKWSATALQFTPLRDNDSLSVIPSEYITIENCTIHDVRAGIYPNGIINHIRISGNHIYNMNLHSYWGAHDDHAIALQGGGDDVIIENNHLHNLCGEGIVLYYDYHWPTFKNFIVRYNIIHDVRLYWDAPYANIRGIDFGTGYLSFEDLSEIYNDSIYYNLIYNIGDSTQWDRGTALRINSPVNPVTGQGPWHILNNTIINSNIGLEWGYYHPDNTSLMEAGFQFRNNIVFNSRFYHIYFYDDPVTYNLNGAIMDNNLYFPDGENMFYTRHFGAGNFEYWRTWNLNYNREQNSILANPQFANAEGYDFHLTESSPAIDAGQDMGLTMDLDGNPVFQGSTPDIGAFESPYLSTTGGSNLQPQKFELLQNYPNPFNPRTTFTYFIPFPAQVELSIYNLAGQKVQTLVNDRKIPGKYNVTWDASNVSSGLYLYQLKLNKLVISKKCIVLK